MTKAEKTALKQIKGRTGCAAALRLTAEYIGKDGAARVLDDAVKRLTGFNKRCKDLPKAMEMHKNAILPTAALYLALKEELPDRAMDVFERAGAEAAEKAAKSLRKLIAIIPGGRSLFIKLFASIGQKKFGEAAGFENTLITSTGRVCRFDITRCPYMGLYTELGCPEVCHVACNADVQVYGTLKGIRFTRTQTLGTGGERCDFLLEKI